jgi:hypothetical protein
MNELPQAFAPEQVAVVTGAASGIQNRPALSRWHPDYEAEFARNIAGS